MANFITMVNTMGIDITLMSIMHFHDPLSYCLHLIFLGLLMVLPGHYPQADPNSKASDTVAHKENQMSPY
jgi:hypothetical protein